MATKTISLANLGNEIRQITHKHAELHEKKSNQALRAAIIKTWGNIIVETPVDEGRARGNWFVSKGTPETKIGGKSKNKGANYVLKNTNKDMFGNRWYLANNLPYISTLEYGGYKGVGAKTVQGEGGIYSQLAPKGMVRVNLMKFPAILEQAFKAVSK